MPLTTYVAARTKGDRSVRGVVRQHLGGRGAVARRGCPADDVLADHDDGERERSQPAARVAEVTGHRPAGGCGGVGVFDAGLGGCGLGNP